MPILQYTLPSSVDPETLPLNHHAQIPYIIDILSRSSQHHALIYGISSDKIQHALLQSITEKIKSDIAPKILRNAEVYYCDVNHFLFTTAHDFHLLHEEMEKNSNPILFVTNSIAIFTHPDSEFTRSIQSKLKDPRWHFLVFTHHYPEDMLPHEKLFSLVHLNELTETETLAILKSCQHEIEQFHDIFIPEEVLPYALSLATHYLGGESHLDTVLALLDSGAARASMISSDESFSDKPVLTTTILSQVVSSWTHIPLSHLHHNKFKLTKFLSYIQQKIIGQEAAINAVGTLLQSTCLKFKLNPGPVFNLLLCGPSGVGKKEFSLALTEYLFSTQEALLHINLSQYDTMTSLADVAVTIHSDKKHKIGLWEAIQSKPYAVILFENLHEAPASTLHLFNDIFVSGYAIDNHGNHYDFRHAIIIITTTLGSERITAFAKKQMESGASQALDLMQLVLNDNGAHHKTHRTLSSQEISEHIIPELYNSFSDEVIRHSHIIPFMPLDQTSVEKIIKQKLTSLTNSLHDEFDIELSFAIEVIKFLSHETLKQHDNSQPLNKILEQHVHANIASEILSRIDDKNRPKRIALLLNESGQLLRCEFMVTHEGSLHSI